MKKQEAMQTVKLRGLVHGEECWKDSVGGHSFCLRGRKDGVVASLCFPNMCTCISGVDRCVHIDQWHGQVCTHKSVVWTGVDT